MGPPDSAFPAASSQEPVDPSEEAQLQQYRPLGSLGLSVTGVLAWEPEVMVRDKVVLHCLETITGLSQGGSNQVYPQCLPIFCYNLWPPHPICGQPAGAGVSLFTPGLSWECSEFTKSEGLEKRILEKNGMWGGGGDCFRSLLWGLQQWDWGHTGKILKAIRDTCCLLVS